MSIDNQLWFKFKHDLHKQIYGFFDFHKYENKLGIFEFSKKNLLNAMEKEFSIEIAKVNNEKSLHHFIHWLSEKIKTWSLEKKSQEKIPGIHFLENALKIAKNFAKQQQALTRYNDIIQSMLSPLNVLNTIIANVSKEINLTEVAQYLNNSEMIKELNHKLNIFSPMNFSNKQAFLLKENINRTIDHTYKSLATFFSYQDKTNKIKFLHSLIQSYENTPSASVSDFINELTPEGFDSLPDLTINLPIHRMVFLAEKNHRTNHLESKRLQNKLIASELGLGIYIEDERPEHLRLSSEELNTINILLRDCFYYRFNSMASITAAFAAAKNCNGNATEKLKKFTGKLEMSDMKIALLKLIELREEKKVFYNETLLATKSIYDSNVIASNISYSTIVESVSDYAVIPTYGYYHNNLTLKSESDYSIIPTYTYYNENLTKNFQANSDYSVLFEPQPPSYEEFMRNKQANNFAPSAPPMDEVMDPLLQSYRRKSPSITSHSIFYNSEITFKKTVWQKIYSFFSSLTMARTKISINKNHHTA